jgi:(p)ppGpp synthase/HD superfamily hydrolase
MELRASAHYVGELLKLVDNPDLRWIPRVKLADRLHNLYDSDHETPDQIDKICDETEREYYVLADRVDPEIGRIFRKKVGELRKLAVRKRVEKELEKKASKR